MNYSDLIAEIVSIIEDMAANPTGNLIHSALAHISSNIFMKFAHLDDPALQANLKDFIKQTIEVLQKEITDFQVLVQKFEALHDKAQ